MEEERPRKLKNVKKEEDLKNGFVIFKNDKGHLGHFTRFGNFEKYRSVSELQIFT